MYSLLNYLEDKRQNMIPNKKKVIPTAITIKPLTAQPGLLYINDEDGPTMDLLCNVNVTPRILNIRPTMINGLPMRLIGFINYRHLNIQKDICPCSPISSLPSSLASEHHPCDSCFLACFRLDLRATD